MKFEHYLTYSKNHRKSWRGHVLIQNSKDEHIFISLEQHDTVSLKSLDMWVWKVHRNPQTPALSAASRLQHGEMYLLARDAKVHWAQNGSRNVELSWATKDWNR